MNLKPLVMIKPLLSIALIATSISICAEARERWHGGNIRHFEMHDRPIWRGGHWRHARYGGRLGWWWIVGPTWYFYSRPIYPYPDPYTPPVIVNIAPTSQAPAPATPPPQAQNWYYCEASKEYYPYTPTCPGGWKMVPVTPPK